jgi:ribose transport system substrate-binding protein
MFRGGKDLQLIPTIVVASLCVLGLAIGGCGDDDDDGSAGGDTSTAGATQKPVRIAFLTPSTDTYSGGLKDGFDQTVEKLGAESETHVANFDPDKQLQQCQDVVTKGEVQAMMIYPVDNTAIVPCVRQALDAGIKVTSTDTVIGPEYGSLDIQVEGVSGQVVLAPHSDGAAAANLVRKACEGDDDCQVALFVGVPSLAYSAEHAKAVEDELADEPNIKIVGKVTAGFDDAEKGMRLAQDLLTAHPELDVISGDDDPTLQGANRYFQRENSRVKTIGDGGGKLGVDAIKNGIQFGTVAAMPRDQASLATEMAIKAVRGEKIDEPSVDYATLSPVGTLELTKENIDKFEPQW